MPSATTQASCEINRRTAVTRSSMAFKSAKRAPLMAAFNGVNRKKCAGARSECKEGDQAQLQSSEPGIGAHGSYCVQGHYRETASIFQYSAIIAVAVAVFPNFMQNFLFAHCFITLWHYLSHWLRLTGGSRFCTAGHMQSMLCLDSPHVSEETCICAHTCTKLPLRYDTIHRTF